VIIKLETMTGIWTRARSTGHFFDAFTAFTNNLKGLLIQRARRKINISGRWAVNFLADGVESPSVGEFKPTGNNLTGTILTTTGDYRYWKDCIG
jgi:hypothetical protein